VWKGNLQNIFVLMLPSIWGTFNNMSMRFCPEIIKVLVQELRSRGGPIYVVISRLPVDYRVKQSSKVIRLTHTRHSCNNIHQGSFWLTVRLGGFSQIAASALSWNSGVTPAVILLHREYRVFNSDCSIPGQENG
jgi:hypothetical protein